MNKFIPIIVILTIALFESCQKSKEQSREYFLDIAFDTEYEKSESASESLIKKWDTNIKVFLKDTTHSELVNESEKIIDEINQLSTSIAIERVFDESDANFKIFFCDKDTYSDFEPNAKEFVENNYGFVWVYWNSLSEIYKGSMYVDVIRTNNINCQKHLLREELTQGLGLLNDSYMYSESIFYQDWTCFASYTEIDKLLVKYILNPEIESGMNKNQIAETLKNIK